MNDPQIDRVSSSVKSRSCDGASVTFAPPWFAFLVVTMLMLSPSMACPQDAEVSTISTADDEVDELSDKEFELVRAFEKRRISAINRVIGSVVAIYDDERQGGGSGVIITPSGIALTNHHVIMGAGISGWGGIADGKLYRWKLIGTDPGGDVAIIQMEGSDDFPFTPLGDSDQVRVGDWALAMGNPFILTEDQSPTVTLGIVSGVKRYQPGAGLNQLVYGNCIQVDSSINPGNSGGPLFNLEGEVIGINGRGSFGARQRVNVGLGYAISANQIKNFIPDLLATKLVEHATIDANFEDRGGKVVCSKRLIDSPVANAGLELGDELLEFEGVPIVSANQYTNLICTLPEAWPVQLKIRKKDGSEKTIAVRAFGLPYQRPRQTGKPPEGKTPEEKKKIQRHLDMVKLLSAKPGEVRYREINRGYAQQLWQDLISTLKPAEAKEGNQLEIKTRLQRDGKIIGRQTILLDRGGTYSLNQTLGESKLQIRYLDGKFTKVVGNSDEEMSLIEAKKETSNVYALGLLASVTQQPMSMLGTPLIDSSDKAIGKNAFRMKLTDVEGDAFFVWLGLQDAAALGAGLLKASADPDGDDGAVAFESWTEIDGILLPKRSRIITGLSEATVMEIEIESTRWLPSNSEGAQQ